MQLDVWSILLLNNPLAAILVLNKWLEPATILIYPFVAKLQTSYWK